MRATLGEKGAGGVFSDALSCASRYQRGSAYRLERGGHRLFGQVIRLFAGDWRRLRRSTRVPFAAALSGLALTATHSMQGQQTVGMLTARAAIAAGRFRLRTTAHRRLSSREQYQKCCQQISHNSVPISPFDLRMICVATIARLKEVVNPRLTPLIIYRRKLPADLKFPRRCLSQAARQSHHKFIDCAAAAAGASYKLIAQSPFQLPFFDTAVDARHDEQGDKLDRHAADGWEGHWLHHV